MKTLVCALLLGLLSATPLYAQLKGKPAPDFKAGESVTSKPPAFTLEECKAEVVIIKLWGIK